MMLYKRHLPPGDVCKVVLALLLWGACHPVGAGGTTVARAGRAARPPAPAGGAALGEDAPMHAGPAHDHGPRPPGLADGEVPPGIVEGDAPPAVGTRVVCPVCGDEFTVAAGQPVRRHKG